MFAEQSAKWQSTGPVALWDRCYLQRGTLLPCSILMHTNDCRGMKREDVSRPVSMEDFHQVRTVQFEVKGQKQAFIL